MGIVSSAIRLFAQSVPHLVADAGRYLIIAQNALLLHITVEGQVKGETSPKSLASNMRAIMPLPCLRQLSDITIATTN